MALPIDTLVRRAAEVAPLVDAAAISVFRSAGSIVGSQVRALIQQAGLSSGAIVIDMAEFLAAGRLDRPLIDMRYRYGEVDGLDGVLADWSRRGLLTDQKPSQTLQEMCRQILALREQVAESIWDEATAGRVADITLAAVTAGGGPLLAAGLELPVPRSTRGRCHHALNLMRWARHGAHAAAWLTRGLGGDEISALRASEDDRATALTEAVERDTNLWCVPMMVMVGDKFDDWRHDLGELVLPA